MVKKSYKTNNGFSIFYKLFLFLPLLILHYIEIPYNISFLFTNFIFYLFALIFIIIVIKNEQYIYSIFLALLFYMLIIKSFKSSPILLKPSEAKKNLDFNKYNKHLLKSKSTLEEEIVKTVKEQPNNIPDINSFEPSEC